jgi:hypothetical protein
MPLPLLPCVQVQASLATLTAQVKDSTTATIGFTAIASISAAAIAGCVLVMARGGGGGGGAPAGRGGASG